MTVHMGTGGRLPGVGATRHVSLSTGIALAVGGGVLGALLDVVTGQQVLLLFAVGFTVGAGLATARVHPRDMVPTVVMVPLVYLVLLVGGGLVAGNGHLLGWLLPAFIIKAPVVLVATTAAGLIAAARRPRWNRR